MDAPERKVDKTCREFEQSWECEQAGSVSNSLLGVSIAMHYGKKKQEFTGEKSRLGHICKSEHLFKAGS